MVGLDNDCCMSYNTLTPNNSSDIMMLININYQVAVRNNKQSGSHGGFCNYVGTCHFLFYSHLWLLEQPNLLNRVVPMLSKATVRQSSQAVFSSDACASSTSAATSKIQLRWPQLNNPRRLRRHKYLSRKLMNRGFEFFRKHLLLDVRKKELLTPEAEKDSNTSDVQTAPMEVCFVQEEKG